MLAIYSPDVPPVAGGVADQTLALATALARSGQPPLVLARRGDDAAFGAVRCCTGVAVSEAPSAAAALGATRILLQYVPFLYARHGVAPALWSLPEACRRAGIPLDLFVHEPFVPLTRPAWVVTGLPQRLQLRGLARGATRVFTPVPAFASAVRRWAGSQARVTVAPVGASIPVAPPEAREGARRRLGLAPDDVAIGVFSPGASGFLGDWVRTAAARHVPPPARWVLFGSGSAGFGGMPPDRTTVVAETDAARIAETMRAMDLVAQPYVDGLTLRRTSAMLALATGVPTVSSTGPLYDPTAGALACCESNAAAFGARLALLARDPAARVEAAARTSAYEATASVEALAALLLSASPTPGAAVSA